MTGFEAGVSGGLGGGQYAASGWARYLVPILTAAIVIALGMAIVGLTNDETPPPMSTGPVTESEVASSL